MTDVIKKTKKRNQAVSIIAVAKLKCLKRMTLSDPTTRRLITRNKYAFFRLGISVNLVNINVLIINQRSFRHFLDHLGTCTGPGVTSVVVQVLHGDHAGKV